MKQLSLSRIFIAIIVVAAIMNCAAHTSFPRLDYGEYTRADYFSGNVQDWWNFVVHEKGCTVWMASEQNIHCLNPITVDPYGIGVGFDVPKMYRVDTDEKTLILFRRIAEHRDQVFAVFRAERKQDGSTHWSLAPLPKWVPKDFSITAR